jgi:hypothetical protein
VSNGGDGGAPNGTVGVDNGDAHGGGGATQAAVGPGGTSPKDAGDNGDGKTGGRGGEAAVGEGGGGAGGGGGFFGGGGGGSGYDPGISGAGGGGGSSYSSGTDTAYTSGFQSGNGEITLTWTFPTAIMMF